jgi:hypothetical protein
MADHGGDGVVTIGENVRFHDDVFAYDPFDWKASALDFRRYSSNDHALRRPLHHN